MYEQLLFSKKNINGNDMKTTINKIANLSDDIRQIVINAYGERLEMIRLCKDHHNPFLHHDKKPILNITQDEFVGIFDLNSNHFFLSPEQVFRLGEYCKLALPNIVAFMMKAEWESFLSEMAGYSIKSGLNLESILSDHNLIEMYIPDFKPDKRKILNLTSGIHYSSNTGKINTQINFFISDLLKGKNFLIENEQVGQLYPEKDITEKILLHKISEPERETYFHLKELWKLKSTELDDLLLYLERKKRVNMNLENRYYRTFSEIETEKSGLTYRVEKYKMILKIMQDQPELSYRELVKLAIDRLIETNRERNDIKTKVARSLNCIEDFIIQGSTSPVSTEFKNSYMQACKKLLRKLFFLLHSDTCPQYSGLSQQKKTEINNLWLKLMKSSKDELYSFSPAMLLYDLPDYEQLESIYKRACEILDINPDDFEPGNRLEFMIRKGTPIKEIMEFLKDETERLELLLANLELVQNEYTREDQSQLYRNALANIGAHSEKLKNEILDLKKQIIQLKKKISSVFRKVMT